MQIDIYPAARRFGFTPLYTSFDDVWDAVAILKDSCSAPAGTNRSATSVAP